MKTIKLLTCLVLICACNAFAQTQTLTPQQAPLKPVQPGNAPGAEIHPAPANMQQRTMGSMQPGMRLNRYMVQLPHTKEQCKGVMNQMKEKGNATLMRFDWGCASGDHTGYAMLMGQKEEDVRKQLPEGLQKTAKITKVDKYNVAQLDSTHR